MIHQLNQLYTSMAARYKILHYTSYWRRYVREHTGSTELTPAEKAAVDQLYKPYMKGLPIDLSYIFHTFYKEKTGTFSELWLPDDLYYCFIDPHFNNWESARVIDNKCLYGLYWPDVRQPEKVADRIGGIWKTGDTLLRREEVLERIASEPEVVIKRATESEGGHGVYFCPGHDREKALEIFSEIQGDIVIQKVFTQHPQLAALNPTSVNTIRIVTLLNNNSVRVCSILLRMGMNSSRVDNLCSGGITCGITESGQLKKYAYRADGERFTVHPNTGITFEGYPIPSWRKAMDLVVSVAPRLPQFRLVSWDVGIDEQGETVFIEGNLKYGQLDLHQLNNGPLFGSDTISILDEVLKK
jgi:hypothetical protein